MTVYTEEVERVFQTIDNPDPRFIVDVSEKDGHLFLLVYRQNVIQFTQSEKVILATYLYRLRDSIRMCGVRCEIAGIEDTPPAPEHIVRRKDQLKQEREGLA